MAQNLEESKQSLLIFEIKKKKVLHELGDSLVLSELNNFLKRNHKVADQINSAAEKHLKRSASFKQAIKEVRAILHKTYGVFSVEDRKKRDKLLTLLENSKDKKDIEIHKKILETNLSTKERIPIYDTLYQEIFKVTSTPLSILDLSSGLNPISFPWMGLKAVFYTSTEINENDKGFLNRYFAAIRSEGLDGKALTLDLTQETALRELELLSQVDVTFMFKVLESIELSKKRKYRHIEDIIKSTKSKWIIASFATKTISGKSMKFKQRRWFDLMLARLGVSFSKIEKHNEVFYIIKNKN